MFKVSELLKIIGARLVSEDEGVKIKGISIDTRTLQRGEAFIAIKGPNFDGHDFIQDAIDKGANTIICHKVTRSQGHQKNKKINFIIVKDTIKALGDIARYQRLKFNIPIIAVTGSNGKTTTKDMITWVLSRRFKVLKNEGTKNNHIGLPLTLLKLDSSYDIGVLEIGTNHHGEVAYLAKIAQANIGVITNIGPAHIEHFGNYQGIFKEKYSLMKYLLAPRIAVLNSDDSLLQKKTRKKTAGPVVFSFGIKNQGDFFASGIKINQGKIEFLVNQKSGEKYKFSLKGLSRTNVYNALAAIAVGRIFGLEYTDISRRLALFEPPLGRLNLIENGKARFIDDTYNSNPLSLRHAIEALKNFSAKGRKIFMMGDMLELGKYSRAFHRQAGSDAAAICDTFITVGKLARLAAEGARDAGLKEENIFHCENSSQAREVLFNQISPGLEDIVLVKGSRMMRMEEVIRE